MSTPRCIASDIFDEISATVEDAGVCATSADGIRRMLRQINLAQSALVKRVDTEGLLWDFPVPVYQGCFALPQDCESDRNIFINGFPAIQRYQWYEGKLSWGRNGGGTDCRMQCIDEGQFPIPLPLPKAHSMRVALIAESAGDAGKEVRIEVINQYGTRVQETITLLADGQPAVCSSMVYDVTLFNKPLTVGSIQLQVRYDDGARFQIGNARYGPKVRQGYFRRKKLPRVGWGCNAVVIKGKLRSYPVTDANDILPFTDVHAWRWACMAVDAETRGDREAYNSNLAQAIQELARSMQDSDPSGSQANARFSTGFGTPVGRRCWA